MTEYFKIYDQKSDRYEVVTGLDFASLRCKELNDSRIGHYTYKRISEEEAKGLLKKINNGNNQNARDTKKL